jgi:hypothetical protein
MSAAAPRADSISSSFSSSSSMDSVTYYSWKTADSAHALAARQIEALEKLLTTLASRQLEATNASVEDMVHERARGELLRMLASVKDVDSFPAASMNGSGGATSRVSEVMVDGEKISHITEWEPAEPADAAAEGGGGVSKSARGGFKERGGGDKNGSKKASTSDRSAAAATAATAFVADATAPPPPMSSEDQRRMQSFQLGLSAILASLEERDITSDDEFECDEKEAEEILLDSQKAMNDKKTKKKKKTASAAAAEGTQGGSEKGLPSTSVSLSTSSASLPVAATNGKDAARDHPVKDKRVSFSSETSPTGGDDRQSKFEASSSSPSPISAPSVFSRQISNSSTIREREEAQTAPLRGSSTLTAFSGMIVERTPGGAAGALLPPSPSFPPLNSQSGGGGGSLSSKKDAGEDEEGGERPLSRFMQAHMSAAQKQQRPRF